MVHIARRVFVALALVSVFAMVSVGCGRRGGVRVVARDSAGGVLELNGRYAKARQRADRLMARYCSGPYTVLNDHELGPQPPRSVRRHMLQYQCGAAQVVHVQADQNSTVYVQQPGAQPVHVQPQAPQGYSPSPSGQSPSSGM